MIPNIREWSLGDGGALYCTDLLFIFMNAYWSKTQFRSQHSVRSSYIEYDKRTCDQKGTILDYLCIPNEIKSKSSLDQA